MKKNTNEKFFVLNTDIVPEALLKVMEVKSYLSENQEVSITKACQVNKISRSVFYKYRDFIFPYVEQHENKLRLFISLESHLDALTNLLTIFVKTNVLVLMLNKSTPVQGISQVILTLDLSNSKKTEEQLVSSIVHMPTVRTCQVL